MLDVSANFTTKNAAAVKQPVYLVHFDGEGIDYVTSTRIGSPDNTLKAYIKTISGMGQAITPEEGKSSFGQITVSLVDKQVSGIYKITELLANDANNLQRKKTVIKGGYMDMAEADMVTLLTGWITDIKMATSGAGYDVVITDPLKWLQRKIFRGSEDTPVNLLGNPVNIMLAILTSTGNGTNGDYDWYAEENGLGIDDNYINITHIEAERDKWFHGLHFNFDIRKRRKAKDFLENEIFKVLNIYPIIRGDGVFDIKVFRPPLPEEWGNTQTFTEDTIIGLPTWDQNMKGVINEVEISFDYDAEDSEFDSINFYIDATSVSGRGPGNKSLEIESEGLTTNYGGTAFAARRSRRIFSRYTNPPPIVKFDALFSRQLSEVGDVVPVTHSKLPNLADGTRGITEHYMEIIKRDIDWMKGVCKFTALYTNYTKKQYAVISPTGTVASGASTTVFTLESDHGAKFEEGWVIDIHYANMVAVATDLTISDITGDQITVDSDIGATPAAGWIINFSSYDNCIAAQKNFYGFLCDSNNKLGAADDDPHYIF